MSKGGFSLVRNISSADDVPQTKVRRDLSGGSNTRQQGSEIAENQVVLAQNADLSIPGEVTAIPGVTLIEDLGNTGGKLLFAFEPDDGTNELLAVHTDSGTSKLEGWTGSSTFTEHNTSFLSGTTPFAMQLFESGSNGSVVLFGDGDGEWMKMLQNHTVGQATTGNTAPPISNVGAFYRGRAWVFANEQLYWSGAYPTGSSTTDGYLTAFDRTTNAYKMPIGEGRAIVGVRDQGLLCFGSQAVYGVNPSVTPVATDKIEPILPNTPCIAGKTAKLVGEDVLFLAPDGVRGVFRTINDKLQLGQSFPISFPLKDEFEALNYANMSNAAAEFFDNKYFISFPSDSQVWIYFPLTQGWATIEGVGVNSFAKIRFNNEEKLYAFDSSDGKVYQFWKGSDFNGTDITFQIDGRKEDMDFPIHEKSGGEVQVRVSAVGQYTVSIYFNPDNNGWNKLGDIVTEDRSVSFDPYSLPMTFLDSGFTTEQFPIDEFGTWTRAQVRIASTGAIGGDLKIIEHSITTFLDQFLPTET